MLPAAPDLNLDDDDFPEADLDNSSRNLEEELDTSLDEDDEPNLESWLILTHLGDDLEADLDPEPDFEDAPDDVLDEEPSDLF